MVPQLFGKEIGCSLCVVVFDSSPLLSPASFGFFGKLQMKLRNFYAKPFRFLHCPIFFWPPFFFGGGGVQSWFLRSIHHTSFFPFAHIRFCSKGRDSGVFAVALANNPLTRYCEWRVQLKSFFWIWPGHDRRVLFVATTTDLPKMYNLQLSSCHYQYASLGLGTAETESSQTSVHTVSTKQGSQLSSASGCWHHIMILSGHCHSASLRNRGEDLTTADCVKKAVLLTQTLVPCAPATRFVYDMPMTAFSSPTATQSQPSLSRYDVWLQFDYNQSCRVETGTQTSAAPSLTSRWQFYWHGPTWSPGPSL